jgi:sRNA-binding carbon storage regulator CsrA
MKRHALTKAITLATLLSATSLSAVAADIPLSAVVEADQITTKVVSVDAANHQVVLEGPEGNQVHVQLTEKAKNLDKLKAGDQVDVKVTRAVAAYLDTDIDKGLPGSIERTGEVRAAPGSDNPGGEAYRQVQVQLKITGIDVKNNRVTFENPKGQSKTVDVVRPEVQAKLKDLKVGQSVNVIYTDVLTVTSKHAS